MTVPDFTIARYVRIAPFLSHGRYKQSVAPSRDAAAEGAARSGFVPYCAGHLRSRLVALKRHGPLLTLNGRGVTTPYKTRQVLPLLSVNPCQQGTP